MKTTLLILLFILLTGLHLNTIASEDFITEQRKDFDNITPEKAKKIRQNILTMSNTTLEKLYKIHPKAKKKIENAYGYGVFDGEAINLVLYVVGKGLGVVFDNKTKTPIFMNALRAGTGPGVGYKSLQAVLIFNNKIVFDQFTNIGLQVSASGDASINIKGVGIGEGEVISLVPGISAYQLIDSSLVLQANWGATEFLKDPNLNK
jgi:hypothetical protein